MACRRLRRWRARTSKSSGAPISEPTTKSCDRANLPRSRMRSWQCANRRVNATAGSWTRICCANSCRTNDPATSTVNSVRVPCTRVMKETTMPSSDLQTDPEFSQAERDAVYKCIFNRRDVRGQFLPNPIPDPVLARILKAAHHAPSVGFMQPWDFIVVRNASVRQKVRDAFSAAHAEAAATFED